MSETELRAELAELKGMIRDVLKARSEGEKQAHSAGLLSYEDLQDRLTIGRTNPHRPCLRTIKTLVRRHRKIICPVNLGHRMVGFREESVSKLLAALAGEQPAGSLL